MWTQLYTQQLCLLCNAPGVAKQCLGSANVGKDKRIGVWSGDARRLMHVADCQQVLNLCDAWMLMWMLTHLSVAQQAGWQLHSAEAGLAAEAEAVAEGLAVQGEAGPAGAGQCHASWDHGGALLLAPGLAPALAWGAQPIEQWTLFRSPSTRLLARCLLSLHVTKSACLPRLSGLELCTCCT